MNLICGPILFCGPIKMFSFFLLCAGKILVFVLFRFKGLRDHLLCILDEELSSMCLCALHCKMRNTEQLLKSVGLLAYEIGSLKQCNEELSKFGPENFHSDRITVKLKPGQQTAPGRNNVSVSSFSGNYYYIILFSVVITMMMMMMVMMI